MNKGSISQSSTTVFYSTQFSQMPELGGPSFDSIGKRGYGLFGNFFGESEVFEVLRSQDVMIPR